MSEINTIKMAITKTYYLQLVAEAKTLGVAEQPYVLASLLNVMGGGTGLASLSDILEALQTFGDDYVNNGRADLTLTPSVVDNVNTVKFLGGTFYNPNAYPVFLKFYEDASPTVGSDPILHQLMVPAIGQVVLDATTVYCENFRSVAATKFYEFADVTAITLPVISYIKFKL